MPLDPALLKNISQTQQERLFHIDFKLRFLGTINRNDLVSRFGIKEAAATRDLSQYKEIAPENLEYDTTARTYVRRDSYKPIFEYSSEQALSALCLGLGDDLVASPQPLVPAESSTRQPLHDLNILATVTLAIQQEKKLRIQYHSLDSGLIQREITPFALIDDGFRWYVRAHDIHLDRFNNFALGRISEAETLSSDDTKPPIKDADIQWNRIVEMHIVPHPGLKHPRSVEREYGMASRMLNIQIRAAVAGFWLRHWRIDCSLDHRLSATDFLLWLKNPQTLYGVENLELAPGYQDTTDRH